MPPFQRSVDIPDLTITRFRKWAPFSGSKEISTGYPSDRGWKKARRKNEANCIFYQIPREILVEIMIQLGPGGIFIARQTCFLMLNIFNIGRFENCHRQTLLDLDPERFTPTLSKFHAKYLSIFKLPPPQPQFVPPVEFGHMELAEEDVTEIRRIFRARVLCERCREKLVADPTEGLPSSEKEKLDALADEFYCWGCEKRHHLKWFLGDKREVPGINTYNTCMGWKGKMRLCPHHTFSRKALLYWARSKFDEPTRLFRCFDCQSSFGRHGRLPTIAWVPSGRTAGIFTGSHLEAYWELPICHLLPGQVLTKDMLRDCLSRVTDADRGLVCEHLSPGGGSRLLSVFSWDRCTCFREPSAGAARCYAHLQKAVFPSCCACQTSQLDPEDAAARAGKFAARHTIRCQECHRQYSWRAEGRRIFLTLYFTVGRVQSYKEISNMLCRIARVPVDREWLSRMDTKTYARAQALKHIAWCDDPKCMNSSRLSGFWFWPEWNR